MLLGYLSVVTYSSTYLPSHIQSLFFIVSMARTNGNVYSVWPTYTQPNFLWLLPPHVPALSFANPIIHLPTENSPACKMGRWLSPQSRPHPNPRNTSDTTVNILIFKKYSRLNKIRSDSRNNRISKKCFLETFISNDLLENGKLQLKDKHPHSCGFCGSFFPIYTRIHFYHFPHLFKYLPLK